MRVYILASDVFVQRRFCCSFANVLRCMKIKGLIVLKNDGNDRITDEKFGKSIPPEKKATKCANCNLMQNKFDVTFRYTYIYLFILFSVTGQLRAIMSNNEASLAQSDVRKIRNTSFGGHESV